MSRRNGVDGGGGGRCELCGGAASTYCESDEARLCWACDASVHGANFLVARHSRSLLCRRCFSATPWRAAGPRLSPTLSLCHRCCSNSSYAKLQDSSANLEGGDEAEIDGDDEFEDTEDDEDDDDGDNQVVPWAMNSSSATTPPPPPEMSSASSSGEAPGTTMATENDEATSSFYQKKHVHPRTASAKARRAAAVDYVASTPPM